MAISAAVNAAAGGQPGTQLGLLAAAVGGQHARYRDGQHRRDLR